MLKRPTGITIIGWAMIVLGGLSFLWSLLVFGVGGASSLFTSLFNFSPTISSSFWSGALGMITAGVQFITGFGLLRLKGWAWYLALIAVGLSVVQGLLGMFGGGFMTFLCGGIGILIPVAILIYLFQPRIRALFNIG